MINPLIIGHSAKILSIVKDQFDETLAFDFVANPSSFSVDHPEILAITPNVPQPGQVTVNGQSVGKALVTITNPAMFNIQTQVVEVNVVPLTPTRFETSFVLL